LADFGGYADDTGAILAAYDEVMITWMHAGNKANYHVVAAARPA
jgi:hypothetical protein